MLEVPNESGSPTGPPEPKSASQTFSAYGVVGAEEVGGAEACRLPWTLSRTHACAEHGRRRLFPGVGPPTTRIPLPVTTMKVSGPSDIGAPPLCQMPAPA